MPRESLDAFHLNGVSWALTQKAAQQQQQQQNDDAITTWPRERSLRDSSWSLAGIKKPSSFSDLLAQCQAASDSAVLVEFPESLRRLRASFRTSYYIGPKTFNKTSHQVLRRWYPIATRSAFDAAAAILSVCFGSTCEVKRFACVSWQSCWGRLRFGAGYHVMQQAKGSVHKVKLLDFLALCENPAAIVGRNGCGARNS